MSHLFFRSLLCYGLATFALQTVAQEGVTKLTTSLLSAVQWSAGIGTLPYPFRDTPEQAMADVGQYIAGNLSVSTGVVCSYATPVLSPNPTNFVNGLPASYSSNLQFSCPGWSYMNPIFFVVSQAQFCPTSRAIDVPWFPIWISLVPGSSANQLLLCQRSMPYPIQESSCVNCGNQLRHDPSPRVGNPISAATGAKIQIELDYRDASGLLTYERTYLSNSVSPSGPFASNHQASLVDTRVVIPPPPWTPPAPDYGCFNGLYEVPAPAGTGLAYRPYCFKFYSYTPQAFAGVYVYIANDEHLTFSSAAGATLQSVDYLGSLSVAGAGNSTQYVLKRNDFSGIEVFNQGGYLAERVRADGKSLTYSYTSINGITFLQSITDSFGRSLVLSYGTGGQIASLTDPAGYVIAYGYGGVTATCSSPGNCARLTSVTYADGFSKNYYYDELAYLAGGTSTDGLLTGIVDELGNRYGTYLYDSIDHAIATQQAGGVFKYSVGYGLDPSSSFIVSASITDPLGAGRGLTFDTVALTSYVSSQSQPAGVGTGAATRSLSYDGQGNVVSQSDFDGNLTCYGNDLTRNLEVVRLEGVAPGAACPSSVVGYVPVAGSAQRLVQTQWHPVFRLKVAEAGPLRVTYWVYNGQPDPSNGNAILSCAPGAALLPDGSPIAVLCKKVEQGTTDATGAAGFGATTSGAARIWTYTYNQWGQALTATGPRGNLASTDPDYAPDTTTYVYYPATVAGSYTMGDLASVTDAAGHVTSFPLYDANGRVLQAIDPNGTSTTYTYAPRGWLLSRTVTPPAAGTSQVTQYAYDGVGQLLAVTNPDGTQVKYSYDAAHRLTTVTDSAGDSINYTLDAMGNRTGEQVKDPVGNLARQITRVYDQLSRLQTVTGALQ